MNKIYKVVYCKATQTFVAVSEFAKSHGKSSSRTQGSRYFLPQLPQFKLAKLSLALFMALGLTTQAYAAHYVGNNVELGDGADASTNQGVAVGPDAKATGAQSISIGGNTSALGASSVAIGGDDTVTASGKSVTYDVYDKDGNVTGTATKTLKQMFEDDTGVIGLMGDDVNWPRTTTGEGAVAIGSSAQALGGLSTAFGIGAKVESDAHMGLSLGTGANVSKKNAVAIGAGATTDEVAKKYEEAIVPILDENGNDTGETIHYKGFTGGADDLQPGDQVSFGKRGYERQLKNVAAGKISKDSTDAVNGSQLVSLGQAMNDKINDKVGDGMMYFHTNYNNTNQPAGNSTTNEGTIKDKAGATGRYAVTAGVNAQATDWFATAIGVDSKAKGNSGLALGRAAEVKSGSEATAIGTRSIANGTHTIAIGSDIQANNYGAIVIGNNSSTNKNSSEGENSVAIGGGGGSRLVAEADGDYSIVLGTDAKSEIAAIDGVVIGHNAKAENINGIAIGSGAEAKGVQSISIGTSNVVTGNNSGAIGDPSTVSGTGSYSIGNDNRILTNDSFVLGSEVSQTIDNSVALGKGSAMTAGAGIGTFNLDTAGFDGTTTTAGDTGDVTEATVTGAGTDVTYGGFAGTLANGVVSVGSAGFERRVQNVAAGEISETSTDAINGSQLYSVAKNTAWKIAGDNETAVGNDVHSGDQVNFKNGNATTATVEENGLNYNVKYDVNVDNDTIVIENGKLKANAKSARVEAGTNIKDVVKTEENGVDVYTVNAKGTTVSNTDGMITVEDSLKDNNITDFKIGLSDEVKEKLKKVDTAIQEVVGENGIKATTTGNKVVITPDFANLDHESKVAITGLNNMVASSDTTEVTQTPIGKDGRIEFKVHVKDGAIGEDQLSDKIKDQIAEKSREVVKVKGSLTVEDDGAKDNREFTLGLSDEAEDAINAVNNNKIVSDDLEVSNGGKLVDGDVKLSLKNGSIDKKKLDTDLYNELSEKSRETVVGEGDIVVNGNKSAGDDNREFTVSLSDDIKTKIEEGTKHTKVKAGDNVTVDTSSDGKTFTVSVEKDTIKDLAGEKIEEELQGDLTSKTITVTNGKKKLLEDVNIEVAKGAIDEDKLSDKVKEQIAKKSRETVDVGDGLSVTDKGGDGDDNHEFYIEMDFGDVDAGNNNKAVTGKAVDDAIKANKTKMADGINTTVEGEGTTDKPFKVNVDASGSVEDGDNKIVTGKTVKKALDKQKDELTNNLNTAIDDVKGQSIKLTGDDGETAEQTHENNIEFAIESGDAGDGFVGDNLKTKAKSDGTVLIGMKDTPEFKSVKVENTDMNDDDSVVNVGALNDTKDELNQNITNVANDLDKLATNTIQLGSDGKDTKTQKLNKDGGLKFNIVGENGLETDSDGNSNIIVKIDDATKTKIDNAADQSLSNINDDAKEVIQDLVAIEDGENTVGTSSIKNGVKTFKVDVAANGKNKAGNTGLVSGDTLHTAVTNPITFTGDESNESEQQLGSTFKILAGNAQETSTKNLKTKVSQGKVEISMAEKPVFEEVKAGKMSVDTTDMTKGDSVVNVDALNDVKKKLGDNITANTTAIGELEKQTIRLTADEDETGTQSLGREEPLEFAIEGKDGGAINTKASGNKVEVEVLVDDTTIEINGDNKLQAKTAGFDEKDGKAVAKSPNSLATAGDIATAINSAKHTVIGTNSDDDGKTNGETEIGAGDELTINAGKNLNLKMSGNEILLSTIDAPEFESAKVENTDLGDDKAVVNVETLKDQIEANKTVLEAGKYTSLEGKGTKDKPYVVDVKTADTIDGDEKAPVNGKAVNKAINDFKDNNPITFVADVNDEQTKMGGTFKIKGSNAEDTSTKNVKTVINGDTLEVQISDKPTFKEVTADKVTVKKAPTEGTDAINLDYFKANKSREVVKEVAGETVVTEEGAGTDNHIFTVGLDKAVTKQIADNKKGVADNKDLIDANKTAIDDVQKLGMNFEDDNGGVVKRELGETLYIKGGDHNEHSSVTNVDTKVVNGNTIEVRFSDRPVFDEVTAKKTTVGGIVTDNTGIDLGNDEKKITGLATDMTDDTGAVNVKSLKDSEKKLGDQITNVAGDLNTLANNTIQLGSDNGETAEQNLNEPNGIKFDIRGKNGIKTSSDRNNTVYVEADLTTLDDTNKKAVAKIAQDAVNVVGGENAEVETTDVNGVKTFTVNVATLDELDNSSKAPVNSKAVKKAIADQADITNTAINKVKEQANKPITFVANDGNEETKLGGTFNIKGGDVNGPFSADNVRTEIDGETLRIKISDKPVFEEVKADKVIADEVIINDAPQSEKSAINKKYFDEHKSRETVTAGDGITVSPTSVAPNTDNQEFVVALNQDTKDTLAKVAENTTAIENNTALINKTKKDLNGNIDQAKQDLTDKIVAGDKANQKLINDTKEDLQDEIKAGDDANKTLINDTKDELTQAIDDAPHKFQGDLTDAGTNSDTILTRKHDEILVIKGGETDIDNLTSEANIGVETFSNNTMRVRLAKKLKLSEEGQVSFGNNTSLNKDKLTINGTELTETGLQIKDGPMFTKDNINANNLQIHEVAAGTAGTDAVNVDQLKAARTTITNGKNITSVNENIDADTGAISYEIDAEDVTAKVNSTSLAVKAPVVTEVDNKIISDYNIELKDEDQKRLQQVDTNTKDIGDNKTAIEGNTTAIKNLGDTTTAGINAVANRTITLTGDDGSKTDSKSHNENITFEIESGDIKGGFVDKNLKTEAKGDTVVIGMSETPEFKAVTTDTLNVTDSATIDGVEIKDGNVDGVDVSQFKTDTDTALATKLTKDSIHDITSDDLTVSQPNLVDDNIKLSIKNGAITNDKLAADAVTEDKIADKLVEKFTEKSREVVKEVKGETVVTEEGAGTDNHHFKVGLAKAVKDQIAANKQGVADNKTLINKTKTDLTTKIEEGDKANKDLIEATETKLAKAITDGDAANAKALADATHVFDGDTGTKVTRKHSDKLYIKGGAKDNLTDKNIGVVADGDDTLRVQLAKDIDLGATGSVTMGDTVINDNGVTIAGGASITKAGINAGEKKIIGVADGKDDHDAVNVSQLENAKTELKGDIKAVDDKATANKTAIDDVKNNTISLTGDDGQTATQELSKQEIVFAIEGENGVETVAEKGTNKVKVKLTDATEKRLAKADSAMQSFKVTAENGDVKTLDKDNGVIDFNGDSKNVTVTNDNGDVKVALKDEITVNKVTSDEVAVKGVVINNDGINAGGKKITNVKAGKDDEDAVNVKQLEDAKKELSNNAYKGWNVKAGGNDNGTGTKTLVESDDTVKLKAGKNLEVEQDGQDFTFKTKDEVEFDKVDVDGVTIDGGKITGLAEGTKNGDAVNYEQLKAVKDKLDKGFEIDADNGDSNTVKHGKTLKFTSTDKSVTTTVTDNQIDFEVNPEKVNLSYSANGGTDKKVSLAKGLDFVDGTNTTAEIESDGRVKFNVETEELASNADGTVQATTSDAPASATSVANAINNASHKVTTETTNTQAVANTNTTTIKTGETLKIEAGKNLVSQVDETGKKVLVSTAKEVEFDKVEVDGIVIDDNGINADNKKITKLAKGTQAGDAVNFEQLTDAKAAAKTQVEAGKHIASVDKKEGTDSTPDVYTVNAKDVVGANSEEFVAVEEKDDKFEVDLSDKSKQSLKKADSALQSFDTEIDGVKVKTVNKDSNKANFITGKNIVLTDKNGSIEVATKDEVEFTKTTVGGIVTDATGINMNGQGITDLASGGDVDTNAANIGDVKRLADAATTKVEVTDPLSIKTVENKDGSKTHTIGAKFETLTSADGVVATPTNAGNFVTAGNIASMINESGFKVQANGTGDELVKSGETVGFNNGTNVAIKQTGQQFEIAAEDTIVTAAQGSAIKVTRTEDDDVATADEFALDLTDETKTNIQKGVDAKEIVDTKGLTFKGDDGQTNLEKLDSIVTVNGDKNISTVAGGDQIQVKLNDNITVKGITTDTATIKKGLTAESGANIDMGGNVIHKVGAGSADDDAVNVAQLKASAKASKTVVEAGKNVTVKPVKGEDGKPDTYIVNAKDTKAHAGSDAVTVVGTPDANDVTDYEVDLSDKTKKSLEKADTGFNITADVIESSASDQTGKKDNVELTQDVKFTGGDRKNIVTTVSNNEIKFDLANKITVGDSDAANPVEIDGNKGTITGLSNRTFDPTEDYTGGKAATEEQLSDVYEKGLEEAKKFADSKTFGLEATNGDKVEKKVDNVIKVVGADDNITTEVKDDKLTIKLSEELKVKKVTGLDDHLASADGKKSMVKPTDLAKTGNDAATVNDVMNAGWNLEVDGEAKDLVTAADTVNFIGEGPVTVTHETANDKNNIKIGIKQGHLETDAEGNVVAKPDKQGFVTTQEVADAINGSGFNVSINGDGDEKLIKSGNKVDMDNTDDNVVITKENIVKDGKVVGQKIIHNLAKDLKVDNITAKKGLTVGEGADAITLAPAKTTNVNGVNNQPALDLGGKSITGLAHNLKDAGDKPFMEKPAEESINRTNAATVNDVLNAGFNLKVNNEAKDFVKSYDTVEFVDGNRTTVEFTDKGEIKVDVDSNQLPVVYTDKDGNKVVKKGQYWYKVLADGSLDTAQVRPNEVKATMQSPTGDTTTGTKLTNVAKATLTEDSKDAVNGGQLWEVGSALGLTFKEPNKDGFVLPPNFTPLDKVDGTPSDKPTNVVSAINGLTDTVNKGINYGSSNAKEGNQKLGSKLDVVASNKADGEDYATDNLTTEYVKDNDGNGTITISMKEKPTFKEVTADTVVVKEGLKVGDVEIKPSKTDVITKGSKPTKALDLGGSTLTNLADNLNDGNGTSETVPADVVGSNAATVNDVLNSGWNLQVNKEAKDFVKSYDTVNFEGDGNIQVKHTTENNVNNIKISLKKGEVGGNGDGDTGGNNGFVTGEQVADAINNSFWTLTGNGDESKKVEVKPKTKVDLSAGDNMVLVQEGTKFVYKTKKDVVFDTVTSKSVTSDTFTTTKGNVTIDDSGMTIIDGPSVTKSGIDAGGMKVTNVKAGTAKTDAVNFGQLEQAKSDFDKKLDAVKDSPITFVDDSNGKSKQNLGSTFKFVGDKNITTTVTKGQVAITMSDDPTFNTVQIGGANGPKIRAEKDEKGNPTGAIQFTKTGKDPKTGKPVDVLTTIQAAPGKGPKDVATVGQVKQVEGVLSDKIASVRKQAQGGSSAAMAAANLPQPHDPGKSMVSAAVGAYESQQAIAIGISTISDNGKWILKGSLTQDTSKGTGAGIGVGYQW